MEMEFLEFELKFCGNWFGKDGLNDVGQWTVRVLFAPGSGHALLSALSVWETTQPTANSICNL